MDIPDDIFDELGPEYDPPPSRRPAGSEAAYRHGATGRSARPLPQPGTRGHTASYNKAYAFPPEDVPGRHWSSRGSNWYTGTPNMAGLDENSVRQFMEYVDSKGPRGLTFDELISTTGTPPEFIDDLQKRGLLQLDRISTGGPYPKELGSYVRVPPGARSKLLKGVTAGLAGLGATGLAKVAAAKSLGALGAPIEYLLDVESRSPTQFLQGQEEFLTGLPGFVSPSELPPPAVLPPDRRKAVEATQGLVGVAQDFESGVVTEQEVRAYVANKFAKGYKLPAWAEKITSMKNGRLSIKPVNPRAKARQDAAKRPRTRGNVLD